MKCLIFILSVFLCQEVDCSPEKNIKIPEYSITSLNSKDRIIELYPRCRLIQYVDGDCPFCIIDCKPWVELSKRFKWSEKIQILIVIETNNPDIVKDYLTSRDLVGVDICIDSKNLFFKENGFRVSNNRRSYLLYEDKVILNGNLLKNRKDMDLFEDKLLDYLER